MAIDPDNLTPTLIRQEAVLLLIAAATSAGANVYDTRMRSIPHDHDTAIIVSSRSSAMTARSQHVPLFRRVETLSVVGYIQGRMGDAADPEADVAERLDTLEAEILSAFLSDAEWSAAFEVVEGVDVTRDYTSEGSTLEAACAIEIRVAYTDEYRITASNDMTSIVTEIDAIDPGAGPDGDIEVEIRTTLPAV